VRTLTRGAAARALLTALLLATASTARAQRAIDLDAATITEINAAFDAGTLSSVQLVTRYLARITAYDRQGPAIHAVITLNAKALETARALDAERKARGKRSPLHGIPIVLKDNFDTRDLPTTGGSVLLEGYVPARDAVLVQKLRDASAIVLAKVNMSEFASGLAYSSLGGQTHNPHDLAFSPGGSSGGTGGSIRGPATVNGIVALKPTHGLLIRTGILPLALSFDTGGPMARSVTDVAIALGALTGVDAADTATRRSEGHAERDFTGFDTDVDWIMESLLDVMRNTPSGYPKSVAAMTAACARAAVIGS